MSGKLSYVEGDLFAHLTPDKPTIIIPHVVNSVGAWGAGFVVPLGKRFPLARTAYMHWADNKPGTLPDVTMCGPYGHLRIGRTQIVKVGSLNPHSKVLVANMVAQVGVGGNRPLRYDALATCMGHVAQNFEANYPLMEIYCPLFGSGLAGGDWNFIEKLIEDCWLSEDIPVTVFYLPNSLPVNWKPPTE